MEKWDSERIFFNGEAYFRAIKQDIQSAAASIDLEVYIYETDEAGMALAKLLMRAARRGARVRVLVDGIGSAHTAEQLTALFRHSGVQFRVYHPVFGQGLFHFLRTLNRRNHRKTWIFDSRAVYAGSMNVAANNWKDYGVRVEGRGVALFENAFQKAWAGKRKLKNLLKGGGHFKIAFGQKEALARLNDTLLKRRLGHRYLLKSVRDARQRVWLANAYFVPNLSLVRALCKAARAGVDVRLIVPKDADVFFMPWLSSTYYLGLIRAGVKIYEYLPAMFHAKAVIIDAAAALGSSNLNYRSLMHDLEADVRITHAHTLQLLEEELESDFGKSQLVTVETLAKAPWYRAVAAKIFRLLKYWL